jgi:hypothetical protein
MGSPNASGPLPCGFSAPIDDKLPWVGMDVVTIPRHLSVKVDLDLRDLALQENESVEVLQVLFPPDHGHGAWTGAAVSVSADRLLLRWWDGSAPPVQRSITSPELTLVLDVDRGRPATGSFLNLSLTDGSPSLRLGPIDLGSAPSTAGAAAIVRFGVLAKSPGDLGSVEPRGRLRFRPLAIESGWGLK